MQVQVLGGLAINTQVLWMKHMLDVLHCIWDTVCGLKGELQVLCIELSVLHCRRLTASDPGEALRVSVHVTHPEMGEFFCASLAAKRCLTAPGTRNERSGLVTLFKWVPVYSVYQIPVVVSIMLSLSRRVLLLLLLLCSFHPAIHWLANHKSDSDLGMHIVQPLNSVDSCDCFQVLNWQWWRSCRIACMINSWIFLIQQNLKLELLGTVNMSF